MTQPRGPSGLATAIYAAMGLQDLQKIRHLYPDAIDDEEAARLHQWFVGQLEAVLQRDEFRDVSKAYVRPQYDGNPICWELAFVIALLIERIPGLPLDGLWSEDAKQAKDQAIASLGDLLSPPMRRAAERIINLKLFDCRIPHPADDEDYRDPTRFLQLFRAYWKLLSEVMLFQAEAPLGWTPHPLMACIVNLRDRIRQCLEALRRTCDVSEVSRVIDSLVELTLSGDVDDLSAVPEFTTGEVNKVARFCEEARLSLGCRTFVLTHAEEVFLDQARRAILEWKTQTRQAWRDVERRIDAMGTRESAAARQSNRDVCDPAPVPSPDEIRRICASGEDQWHEFKAPGVEMRKIAKEIAGMLNTRYGGRLLYGVKDDGTIVGSDMRRQDFDQPLQNSVRNMITPAAVVSLHAVNVLGETVLVIIVPPWNRQDVYAYEGRVYVRKGTNSFEADADERKRLYRGDYVV